VEVVVADLSADQKIAIQEYVKSLEDKKDQKLWSQVNKWLGVIGLSVAAILSWFWVTLQDKVLGVARTEAGEIANSIIRTGEIETARSEAYKAIYSSEASATANLERSKSLLAEINGSLDVAQRLKEQFRSAKEISDAAAALNAAKQGIVAQIKSDKELLSQILGNVVIPSGVVVAYSVLGEASDCPDGWKWFTPASGRFIVGAGPEINKDVNGLDLTVYGPGTIGGMENQTLSVNQLPPQSIKISGLASVSRVDRFNAGGKDYPVVGVSSGTIDTGGAGAPISNMPPYLALYYCVKE
jgi:hypothetical protein